MAYTVRWIFLSYMGDDRSTYLSQHLSSTIPPYSFQGISVIPSSDLDVGGPLVLVHNNTPPWIKHQSRLPPQPGHNEHGGVQKTSSRSFSKRVTRRLHSISVIENKRVMKFVRKGV